jgi:thaumarchaeosortase
MFYLLFLWLFIVESLIDWDAIINSKPSTELKLIASVISAFIPTIYILAINFLGLDQLIIDLGERLKIGAGDFIFFHWPLSWEYLILATFFMTAVLIAYNIKGLKLFSISFAFLSGVATAYMFDTIYPFGVFKPLQEFALPTAATAAAILDLFGYKVMLKFPVQYGDSNLPALSVTVSGKSASVIIAWACAGAHSLLLYALIILVFFKKMEISHFRKLAYFMIGLFVTYFVNVIRICSILFVILNYGSDAGRYFHDTYAELFFFTWIFAYIGSIILIQRFMLIERIKQVFQKTCRIFRKAKDELTFSLKSLTKH